LSTVYFPGGKITMLPSDVVEKYTLSAERYSPALSLYAELDSDNEIVATESRIEQVRIAENLRHDTLEPLFNEDTLATASIDHPYGAELRRLWQWAVRLEQVRRGEDAPEGEQRPEYVFRVEGDSVQITRRARGTPIDKVVSELMIYVNSTWGRALAEGGTAAIYRVQGAGKVRMSTVPAAHAGLGVEQYIWASSPLRRYVDLVNQRQLIAMVAGEAAPYAAKDERLLAILREFESSYDAYADFQRSMERYWCLRWLLQEKIETVEATVLRENLCRFDALPLVVRVASLPSSKSGDRVLLDVSEIDVMELSLHCEFASRVEPAPGTESVPVLQGLAAGS
jgi:exoribonuclease-2